MKELAKREYLQLRGRVWWVRRKVPKNLVAHFGKAEMLVSLETSDEEEARRRRNLVLVEIDEKFEEARNRPVPKSRWRARSQASVLDGLSEVPSLPLGELQRLASDWLAYRERTLSGEGAIPATGEEVKVVLENVEEDLGWLQGGGDDLQLLSSMQSSANDLLASQGIKMAPASNSFRDLVGMLKRAEIVRLRRVKARLQGDFSPQSIDPLFDATRGHGGTTSVQLANRMKLSELFERFVTDPGRELEARSVASYRTKFRVLKELMGDGPIALIAREDCRRVQADINVYPVRAQLRYPNLPASKVVEIARREKLKPLHPKTATGYLELLSSLFKFAVREELMGKNPAEGLAITREVVGHTPRRKFNADELRKIFSPPHYRRASRSQGAEAKGDSRGLPDGNYWVPLVGLFTGMRLNECCQLLADDVKNENGVWVIHIRRDSEGRKKLKTKNATRAIPIHPELERLGFIDFAIGQQAKGAIELFPDLSRGAKGSYSEKFQKVFARFLDKSGVTDPGATFHSFRHTFRDGLRNARVSEEVARRLNGWSRGSGAEAVYGEGFDHDVLKEEISKVRYRDLDLSHLYPRQKSTAEG